MSKNNLYCQFSAGSLYQISWFHLNLESAYSNNPKCKVSCFLPKVNILTIFCYISTPLLPFLTSKGVQAQVPLIIIYKLGFAGIGTKELGGNGGGGWEERKKEGGRYL